MKVNYFNTKIEITDKSAGYYGSFLNGEIFSFDLIQRFLSEIQNIINPIILDVGACTGSYSLLDVIKKDAMIYSFEPSRAFYELEKNIALNKSKTRALKIAVSDRLGKFDFSEVIADGSIALSMLGGKPADHKICEKVEVDVITIDEFCKSGIAPYAIKIDTEGHEYFVLNGAKETIKKYHPIIFCEYSNENTNQFGYGRESIVELLVEFGYEIEYFGNSDIIAKWAN